MMSQSEKWWALAFLVLAQFMIVLDVSILNVALPSIQREFSLTVTNLQAIVTAYTLAFGGFLLLGGRAADLYGRRRVFLSGVIGFTSISLLIGIAQSETLLVPLRSLQGFSAAFMSPAALSIILTLFRERSERTRALSMWGAVSAGGATVGLLLGGFLTEYLSWRWNFFVNVPIGIMIVIAALRLVPAHAAEESDKTLDLPGAILATSGLMMLVHSLSKVGEWGWGSPTFFVWIGASITLLVAFIVNEWYAKHPLVPLSIFRIGNIAAANLAQLPITAAMFSQFFFLSLYIQNILHYTPLQTGVAFLPSTLVVGMTAVLAPQLIKRIGYKPILVATPLLLACGLFIFAHLEINGTYLDFLPGLLVMAVGLGFTFVSITIAATSGIPPQESGLASGLLSTAQQMGGSIGLAVLSSIAASKSAEVLAGSQDPTATISALLEGFHSAFYVGVCFAIVASLISLFFIRTGRALGTMVPALHP